ncbi:hypothetical protein F4782DRAFT_348627 [Xylaria castorea]|nr:hypothetical protein F4782DRAFT_348627 [Xylaria castorea]
MENACHTISDIYVTYLNFSDCKINLSPILRIKLDSASSGKHINTELMINNVNGSSSNATTLTQGHPSLDYVSTNQFLHTGYFREI